MLSLTIALSSSTSDFKSESLVSKAESISASKVTLAKIMVWVKIKPRTKHVITMVFLDNLVVFVDSVLSILTLFSFDILDQATKVIFLEFS